MSMSNPRIYVACLASYNNGRLHGGWIDAAQSKDEIWSEIEEILESSPTPSAEEWAVHDYEDMPDLGEHPDLDDIAMVGELVERYGISAVKAFSEAVSDDFFGFEGAYLGIFDSEEDFAMQYAEDVSLLSDVPESLKMYFDWEAFARDLFIDGYTMEDGHVFSLY